MDLLTGEWLRLQEELAQRLEQLPDGGRLRLGEPAVEAPPARAGRVGRFGVPKQRRSEPRRYVRFIAGPDVVTAECVGSSSFGGDWSMARDLESSLERLGWGWPLPGTSPHFRLHRRRAEALWLAEAAVAALQLLGGAPSRIQITDSVTEMATDAR